MTSDGTKKAEYVKIQITNQDSLVEPEIFFSARKIKKALALRQAYFVNYSNPIIIDYKNPFKILSEKTNEYTLSFSNGIFSAIKDGKIVTKIPSLDQYKKDLSDLFVLSGDLALKSFCYKRLTFLKYMFSFHLTLNSHAEGQTLKTKCRKDFYHVEKVDQHVAIDSFFSAQTLLKFIIEKYQTNGNDIVEKDENGKDMTLFTLLKRMSPNPETITIDFLDVMVDNHMIHRQDMFEKSLDKLGGGKKLKKVYLSMENRQGGLYFAELTSRMNAVNQSSFSANEVSIRLFGKGMLDWNKVSKWVVEHKIYSPQVRYIILLPRQFTYYLKSGICKNFEQYLSMVFKPLFLVTLDPESNPNLAKFLQLCTGFALQSLENTFDVPSQPESYVLPSKLDENEPDFEYYLYHVYANLRHLNDLRLLRGLNPLLFKPECGDSVRLHLASAFLCAHGVHNPLSIRNTPVLNLLYYLCQIGISLSPLHTNKLMLDYKENPFPELFNIGQNVTLSTNNPLHSHYTQEHLLEEYSVASQIWGFSRCDLCEISNHSVRQSGFEDNVKEKWLGKDFQNKNDQFYSNVPNIRYDYRKDTLIKELEFVDFCCEKSNKK